MLAQNMMDRATAIQLFASQFIEGSSRRKKREESTGKGTTMEWHVAKWKAKAPIGASSERLSRICKEQLSSEPLRVPRL